MPTIKPLRAALVSFGVLLLLAPPSPAQHGAGDSGRPPDRGRGEARGDAEQAAEEATAALEERLGALTASPDPSQADLRAYIMQVTRAAWTDESLPSFDTDPEAVYSPEYRAFRQRWYDPLVQNPATREVLRQLASGDSGDEGDGTSPHARGGMGRFSMAGVSAALCLADHADAADLRAILQGYAGLSPTSRQAVSYARQLGRAVATLEQDGSMEASMAVSDALALLRRDAAEGPDNRRGAAIEGLMRAGHDQEALVHLEELLGRDTVDASRTLPVLQACQRCFQLPGIDPNLGRRAIALASRAAREALASSPSRRGIGISPEARQLRAAVSFLRSVGREEAIDLLIECWQQPRAITLLGMDGLQNLRMGLQRLRARVDDADRARIDGLFHDLLLHTAERLFALDEEPMDVEEQRAFFAARDLRYNAAAFFCDQWRRNEDVRRVWEGEDDAALLAYIVRSQHDRVDGDGDNRLYYAVNEKLETRILVAQLLAYMERDLASDPGLDLFPTVASILAGEVGSAEAIKARLAMSVLSGKPLDEITIPVAREPADSYVYNRAVTTLRTLGWRLEREPAGDNGGETIRLARRAEGDGNEGDEASL